MALFSPSMKIEFRVLRINSFGIDTKMGFEVNKKAILDYKILLKLEFPYPNNFLIFYIFFLSENDVIHAFGVLRINSFGIDTKMGGRGRGLFPLLALMSHSCQSNLQHEQSKSMSAMV